MKHIKKHPLNDKSQKLSKNMKKQDLVKPKSDKKLDADKSLSNPSFSMRTSKPSNRKLDGEKFLAENNNLPAGLDIHGLKCDNPNCNWSDMTVPFSDYEKSINKPCPECGENLLTQEDYDQVMQIKQAVELMATFSEEELDNIANSLSEEEIDQALDTMNQLKMKKKGEDEEGREIWSIGESKKLKNLKRFNESSKFDIDWKEVESKWNDWYEESNGEADYDDEYDAMKSFVKAEVEWSKVKKEYFDYIEKTNNEDDYDDKFKKFKTYVNKYKK